MKQIVLTIKWDIGDMEDIDGLLVTRVAALNRLTEAVYELTGHEGFRLDIVGKEAASD